MYNRKDAFYRKAKREGYRSRAAYKLKEINGKHKLLRKGAYVADVGCAPGGWAQVASEFVGKQGLIIGVDILNMEPINRENFVFIRGDFNLSETRQEIKDKAGREFDLILSDIAPNTTGIKVRDHALSLELCRLVYELSLSFLKKGGNLLMKIFQGEDMNLLLEELRKSFSTVKVLKPKSSRKESIEIYLLAKGKK